MTLTAPAPPRRFALTRPEKRSVGGMVGFVLLLHVLGWGTLVVFVAPAHYELGDVGVFGLGLGLTAYLLGTRHAFDADHIAAIDNTTRKLLADREGRTDRTRRGPGPSPSGSGSRWATRRSCSCSSCCSGSASGPSPPRSATTSPR